jgi:hypothetical protein
MGGLGLGMGGRVLHNEATVVAPDGTTKVVVSQSGDITDVGGSTVTVKSSDGFTATYSVDKKTRIALNGTDGALSSLKSGDSVHVFGTKSGSSVHAMSVVDGLPTGFRDMRRYRHAGPRPTPSPSTST